MFIKALPFDFPYDKNLDPTKTALLVIDMQIDFLSSKGYFAKMGYDPTPLQAIIPAVNKLIEAARTAGCQIVYTRQGYRADLADMTSYDKWRRKQSGLDTSTAMLRGSPGFSIIPEIPINTDDVIIDKTSNGAFTDTELGRVLRAKGIQNLLFTGCTTDVCVHSTLREASDRNFQCLLIEDACASGDAYAHEAAVYMTTIENGVHGCVTGSEAVINGLK